MENIEAVTVRSLSTAMDVAVLRQQVLASNIAHANSVGYVPLRVSFEQEMQEARRSLQARGTVGASALNDVPVRVEPLRLADGQPASVQLDVEVAQVSRNAVQYQALVKGISHLFSILSIAAGDGKK